MSAFSATSTTSDVLEGVRLVGKRAVITGASSGLGFETARSLAAAGAAITITARSKDKAEKALAQLREAVPGADADHVVLELADLKQVRSAAAELLAMHPHIDMLINNAGIMAVPLERTPEGCELQFGANHIGHFLWTCLLASALKTPGTRVVNLSSAGHKAGDVNFDDPHYEYREYDKWEAYGQAKTANILFSVGLSKRGIHANAVHPGGILTNLGRHMEESDYEYLSSSPQMKDMEFKSVEAGAATSVWAATSPALADKSGLYLEDCQISRPVTDDNPGFGYAPYALDKDAAEKLWQLSEQIVGERFTLA